MSRKAAPSRVDSVPVSSFASVLSPRMREQRKIYGGVCRRCPPGATVCAEPVRHGCLRCGGIGIIIAYGVDYGRCSHSRSAADQSRNASDDKEGNHSE